MSASTEIRKLPVPLTDAQKAELANLAVEAHDKAEELELQLKKQSKEAKAEITHYQAVRNNHLRAVARGVEMRDISCTYHNDFESGKVRLHRDDTGEVIEERDLTPAERQIDLGFGDDSAVAADAGEQEPIENFRREPEPEESSVVPIKRAKRPKAESGVAV